MRTSLSKACGQIKLEKVLGPLSALVLKEKDLLTYDKLSKKAGFLFLEARK